MVISNEDYDHQKMIYALEKLKTSLIKICRVFSCGIGSTMSYNEGSSDFYSPIKAGMQIQQIKDAVQDIMDVLGLRYDSYHHKMNDKEVKD